MWNPWLLKRWPPRQKQVHPLYREGGKWGEAGEGGRGRRARGEGREAGEGEGEGEGEWGWEANSFFTPKIQDENLTPEEREKKVRSVVARLVEKLQIPGAEFQLKTLKAIVNFAKSVDGTSFCFPSIRPLPPTHPFHLLILWNSKYQREARR